VLAEIDPRVRVRMGIDRMTGKARGFAFAEFSEEALAAEAIRRCDGVELRGRRLRVNDADDKPPPRAPRPAGPGGFAPSPGGPPRFNRPPGPPRFGAGPGPGGPRFGAPSYTPDFPPPEFPPPDFGGGGGGEGGKKGGGGSRRNLRARKRSLRWG
jgi:RNA recognition motif-containing protein